MLTTPFATQFKASPTALGYSGERVLNWFVRPSDAGAVLLARSGLVPVASDLGIPQGCVEHRGEFYAAMGAAVWRYENGAARKVGDIPIGPAVMASNGKQIAIVVGGEYYICDGETTQLVATGAVTNCVSVTYLDGYFVVAGSSAGRKDAITVSGLDDGTTFDSLKFAFAESASDGLVSVIADHRELWLLGDRSIEVWYNAGALDFPFAPNTAALMERGCLGGVAKEDNAVFWVGPDKEVYRSGGTSPEVISTREVREVLQAGIVQGGFTFSDRGHKFYGVLMLNHPTLCFDLTTGMWSERSAGLSEYPWVCVASALVGQTEYFITTGGQIVTQSEDAYDDAGAVFMCEAVSAPVMQRGRHFSVNRVQVNMQMGKEQDPNNPSEIVLQTSHDGRNWGQERTRKIGTLGNYFELARWNNLGSFERFQSRIRCSDPIQRDVYGVTYE